MEQNKNFIETVIKKLQKDVKEEIREKFNFINKKISSIKTELKSDIKALWKGHLRIEEQIEDLKEEVDKKFKNIDLNFKTVDKHFEEMDKRFKEADEQRRKDKDDMMNKLDYIIGEIQTMREENTVGAYQFRELRNDVNDHEKRLTKLEHS